MNLNNRNLVTAAAPLMATFTFALVGPYASASTVIASQDFEGNALSRGIPLENIAVGLGFYNDMTGVYDLSGLGFDRGVGLGWTLLHRRDEPGRRHS